IHLFANHILTKKYHHDNDENVNYLRQVIGILQHHDAVIGTAKQHNLLLINQFNINNQFNLIFCNLLNISLCNAMEYYELHNHHIIDDDDDDASDDDDDDDKDGQWLEVKPGLAFCPVCDLSAGCTCISELMFTLGLELSTIRLKRHSPFDPKYPYPGTDESGGESTLPVKMLSRGHVHATTDREVLLNDFSNQRCHLRK
ncbi:unnamed protein product, partial [Schistosoma margrebowiei]